MKTNNSSGCQSAEGASAKRGRAQRIAPMQIKQKTMKTDNGSAAQSAAGTPAKPSRTTRIRPQQETKDINKRPGSPVLNYQNYRNSEKSIVKSL